MIAIYSRVSTEEQARKGYSIQSQIQDCKTKVQERLDEVIEYIDDGYSAAYLERPALERLRDDIRKGLVDTVVIWDPDRLSRNLSHLLILTEEIEKSCKLVFYNNEYFNSPEGVMFFQIKGAVSQFERAKTRERIMRGMRAKIESGKILKPYQIYGYTFDQEKYNFEILESEAEIVRGIFHKFLNPDHPRHGVNHIAHWLNNRGIPSKKGKQWHRKVVRFMLSNQAYIGKFIQNKEDWTGVVRNGTKSITSKIKPETDWLIVDMPPIVDEHTFNLVQEKLSNSRRLWANRSKHNNIYLLSGLVRCIECGKPMKGKIMYSRKRKSSGDRKKYFYYQCYRKVAGSVSTCSNSVKCEKLDEIVWNTLCEWLNDPTGLIDMKFEKQQPKNYDSEVDRIKKELKDIEANKNGLFSLLKTPELINDVKKQLLQLKEREDSLNVDLEQIRQKELNTNEFESKKEQLKELLGKAVAYFVTNKNDLDVTHKQNIVRMVIKEIKLDKEGNVDIYTY